MKALCSALAVAGALVSTPVVFAPAWANSYSIDVGTCIDGEDLLTIQGSTLQWTYESWTPVGAYRNDCSASATTITTTGFGPDLNGVQWTPSFGTSSPYSGQTSDVYTAPFTLLPSWLEEAQLTVVQGRESLTLVQIPSASNNYTAVLDFNDNDDGGASYYEAILTFTDVPEPSTWAMTALGFAALGHAGARGARRSARFVGA